MPRKRSDIKEAFIFHGNPVVGWSSELLLQTLVRALDRLVVAKNDPLLRYGTHSNSILEVTNPQSVGGHVTGLALSGKRSGALIHGDDLSTLEEDLALASKLHVPLTAIHSVGSRPVERAVGRLLKTLSMGAFGFMAGSSQETLDLALIAIRVAERALLPGVCGQDVFRSGYDVSSLLSIENDLIEVFLGKANDRTGAGTPAQRLTLGRERPNVPQLLSLTRRAGLNPLYEIHEERLVVPSHAAYFESHLDHIIQEAFDDFGSLTGRFYSAVEGYRTDDADCVVVTAGAAGERLKPIIDHLRQASRLRIGALRLRVLSPLPADLLRKELGGKQAITVLDAGLGSEATLSKAVRWAVGPDGPTIFTFASPLQQDPSRGDWIAAIEHMTSSEHDKPEFFVIPWASASRNRVPGLERTDQVLKQTYPHVPWISAAEPDRIGLSESPVVHLFGLQEALLGDAAGTFIRVLAHVEGVSVEGALTSGGNPSEYVFGLGAGNACTAVLEPGLLRKDAVLNRMTRESVVVVPASSDKIHFWSALPEAFRQVAFDRNLAVFVITPHDTDAGEDDTELGDLEAVYSMLGAVVRATLDGAVSFDDLCGRLEETLVRDGLPTNTSLGLVNSFRGGFNQTERMSRSEAPARTSKEPETPWTLRSQSVGDDTVFDPARFWSTTGFEAAGGRTNLFAPDPYLGSRIVPAQTSVVSARSGARRAEWLPENCTACGLCWTFCPHSALPVTVAGTADFLDAGRSRVEARGGGTTQVQRLSKHLAKRMHKLVTDDGLKRFTSVGDLGGEAIEQLLEAAGLEDEAEAAARAELEAVLSEIGVARVARTETFFEAPEQQSRASGRLLSIAVDPDACTACGICEAVCPDAAIEVPSVSQTSAEDLRQAREISASIPFNPKENPSDDVDPDRELAHRLIDKEAYYATLSGGWSDPGSGTKMALHLVAAVAESLAAPGRQDLLSETRELETKLKEAIQSLLTKSLTINDFDDFAARLRSLSGGEESVDVQDLLTAGSHGSIDTARLQQLSDALLEIESLRERLSAPANPASGLVAVFGNAPTILADAEFPQNPFSFPWINAGKGNSVALARGIHDGLASEALSAIATVRRARQTADDTFEDTAENKPSLDELTDLERAFLPLVCIFTERLDGAMLSAISESGPVRIFWLDDLDDRPGLPGWMPDILFSQSAPAYPSHFMSAISDALSANRSSLTRIYTPEPERHEFPTHQTIHRMKRAVSTRVFPLLRYHPDRAEEWTERWSLKGNPDVTDDWSGENGVRLTPADWLAVEGRFASLFEVIPRGSWDDSQVILDAFVGMDVAEREGLTPVIQIDDARGRPRRLSVSKSAVAAVESCRDQWRLLQEMAGVRSSLLSLARKQVEEELHASTQAERERIKSEAEARIDEVKAGYDRVFHEKLTARLLAISGFGKASGTLKEWLDEVEKQGRTMHAEAPDERNSGE